MLPDAEGVPGGQDCIRSGSLIVRGAVARTRRHWSRRVGHRNPRCPAWLVQACSVLSLDGWLRLVGARAIWLGGRRDRCSTKEGFPGSSRLQHALMPR